jgi:hypothetical protein
VQDYDLGNNEVGTDVGQKLSMMGMKKSYLKTCNPMTEEMDYLFLEGIWAKGNCEVTMKAFSLHLLNMKFVTEVKNYPN